MSDRQNDERQSDLAINGQPSRRLAEAILEIEAARGPAANAECLCSHLGSDHAPMNPNACFACRCESFKEKR